MIFKRKKLREGFRCSPPILQRERRGVTLLHIQMTKIPLCKIHRVMLKMLTRLLLTHIHRIMPSVRESILLQVKMAPTPKLISSSLWVKALLLIKGLE